MVPSRRILLAKTFVASLPARMAAALLAVAVCVAANPAAAGRWLNGGTFDPRTNQATSFLRFLAEEGEGQMTIRCDAINGLWIDAGVTGNGELPEGHQPGDAIDVTLTFVSAGEEQTVTASGSLILREDGAVLVSIVPPAVDPIGRLLLQPADRLDITVAGETRSVPLVGLSENTQRLADRCSAWPE